MIPGEYHVASEPIDYNGGYEAISIEVKNVGDRAAQVGSHYHFYEANEAGLQFDREKARGKRLDIPAGTAIPVSPVFHSPHALYGALPFCSLHI